MFTARRNAATDGKLAMHLHLAAVFRLDQNQNGGNLSIGTAASTAMTLNVVKRKLLLIVSLEYISKL